MLHAVVEARPLDRESFSPYGEVISNPVLDSSTHIAPVSANQGAALKYPNISSISNGHHNASIMYAQPVMALFVCSPRKSTLGAIIDIRLLERHPYTTQTFVPLGLAPNDTKTAYLVVVAHSSKDGTPDLDTVKAFIARGDQGVTYGMGVWHAPMIVIGEASVSFVVTQWVNGVPKDECEEVTISRKIGIELHKSGGQVHRSRIKEKL